MSSTDKADDQPAQGYTLEPEAEAAPSGSPDPTTTSQDKTDDQAAEPTKTPPTEVVDAKEEPEATPAVSEPATVAEEAALPAGSSGDESRPAEAADRAEAESPVEYLKSMFPEMDTDTLEAVLAAHNGSVEGAIEALLAMSDPSAAPPPPTQTTQSLSQLQLDEALAKQLYAEDHAAAQHHRDSSRAAPAQALPPGPPPQVTYQAYVPRSRRATQEGHQMGAQEDGPQPTHAGINPGERDSWHNAAGGFQERHKDELDELTETMTKLADQGKKAFSGFWGKAKEQALKLNDQINASASPSTAQANAAATSAPTPPPKQQPQPQPQSQPRTAQPQRQSSLPSHYNNSLSDSAAPPPTVPTKSAPSPTPAADATLPPTPVAKDKHGSPATTPAATPAAEAASSAGEPSKADFSKIGLLPRQSISLLDRKKAAGEDDSDEEDDLEYVKSPFDDD